MNAAVIVPARFASSRYPGKPLAVLTGVNGTAKSLIRRSWEAAEAAAVGPVFVATEDARIADHVSAFGGHVLMTSESCANGTERCAAAMAALPAEIDLIVNLQGDALLTPPHFLSDLVDAITLDRAVAVATPAIRAAPDLQRRLFADQAEGRVGGTTVALRANGDALYFSKSVIPHVPPGRVGDPTLPLFFHIGVYAYTRPALGQYAAWPPSALEELEGLEQLRFLDAGMPIRIVEVDARGHDIWELNNPGDRPVIEAELARRGID